MLGSASLKHSSPPVTAALPKRGESNMTLHGRRLSRSNAPFQSMFLPAGVDAAADIVASARAAAGSRGATASRVRDSAVFKGISRLVRDA